MPQLGIRFIMELPTELAWNDSPGDASKSSSLTMASCPGHFIKLNSAKAPPTALTARKGGRKLHSAWSFISGNPKAHLEDSIVCKNCQMKVVTFHKSERVVHHLTKKCRPFLETVRTMDPATVPDWCVSILSLKRKAEPAQSKLTADRHIRNSEM